MNLLRFSGKLGLISGLKNRLFTERRSVVGTAVLDIRRTVQEASENENEKSLNFAARIKK